MTSMLNHKQIQELLDLLCVKYGFCLPPAKQDEIVKRPAEDVLGFAEAVIAADGLDPVTLDRHLYRQVINAVQNAFHRAA
jgi:hypothetical protein